jgi:hypothetical protein
MEAAPPQRRRLVNLPAARLAWVSLLLRRRLEALGPWPMEHSPAPGPWNLAYPRHANRRINGAAHDLVRWGVFVQTSGTRTFGSEERMKGTGQTAVASIHGENIGMAWIGTGWSLRAEGARQWPSAVRQNEK